MIRRFGEQETRAIEENAVVKLWFGFSPFEEVERVSKAMGEEHAVATALGSYGDGIKTNTNLSLIKQRHMTPAELMALDRDTGLAHVKGVGFFLFRTISQANVAPYCDLIAENPLEGGRLASDPKITLVTP
ncbi:MAG: TraM recognition domain-containing protein [Pseudomonadota bacterium]